ncbi:hypothetical protein EON65_58380 [archaeon]|nr:MAG: hypothetical protein EON65_58380 [archaeon]
MAATIQLPGDFTLAASYSTLTVYYILGSYVFPTLLEVRLNRTVAGVVEFASAGSEAYLFTVVELPYPYCVDEVHTFYGC